MYTYLNWFLPSYFEHNELASEVFEVGLAEVRCCFANHAKLCQNDVANMGLEALLLYMKLVDTDSNLSKRTMKLNWQDSI